MQGIEVTMAGPDDVRPEPGGYAARIMASLAADPDRVAVHWRGRAVRAGDFADSVAGIVRTLQDLGAGPGSMVGILVAPNAPDMLGVRYAANLLGAAVCHLGTTNPGSAKRALPIDAQLRILLDTSADVLFADAENAERARDLIDLMPGPLTLIGFDVDVPGAVPIAPGSAPDLADVLPCATGNLAMVAFTSGSTGRPKGIRLTARHLDSSLSAQLTSMIEPAPARLLATTPLSHSVAPMADAVLAAGGTVFLQEDFGPAEMLRAVAEHRITRTFMATSHLYQLLDHSGSRTADLSSLRLLVYTGSAAAPARLKDAVEVFGPRLIQAYGTTEGGRITHLDPWEHEDPRLVCSVGRPFPEVELKVCDPDSGAEVEAGAIGEVWYRSPLVMEGYWADLELTARVLRDGWYRTGDIGRLDEDGYLYLRDRVADVVKTHGVKVYPVEVERQILALPGISHAAVYGVRDADGQEHLHAAVVPRFDAQIDPAAIRAEISTALSPLHAPEEILLLDELPLNAAGKPDKPRLRSWAPPRRDTGTGAPWRPGADRHPSESE